MEVLLRNIQSIRQCSFTFPETGLVQIRGDNSNGKSILIKGISAIVTLKILDNDERRALINDNEVEGSITIQYKEKILLVKLHEDRNQCFVTLYRSKEDYITRTFRDGGVAELLEEFGFLVYNKSSICLQVYETFGMMPFVNTTTRVNYEIVDAVTSDSVAQNFLNNFKAITHKSAREKIKLIDRELDSMRETKEKLILFDYKAYSIIYKKMEKLYNILKHLDPIYLEEIRLPPKVDVLDLEALRLQRIKFIKPAPIINKVLDLSSYIRDIKSIENGICPSCGKRFIEERG